MIHALGNIKEVFFLWTYNYSNYNLDVLCHYGVLGMRWGIRKTPLGDRQYKKKYKKFKKSLTSEQRKQNDKEVETWRSNAKSRKSPVSKFDWGDLAKDRKNADYKIFDYYQRNGKSFIEDHNDQYLSQWTKLLEI